MPLSAGKYATALRCLTLSSLLRQILQLRHEFLWGLLLEAIGLFAAVLPVFLSIGLVLAPIGYFVGFEWAIWIHAARRDARQKLKINVLLLESAVVVAVLWAIFPGL